MNRRLAVAVVLGLACATAAVSLVAAPEAGGPLAEAVPPNRVTFPVGVDAPFTYGGLQLRNPGSWPAVLDAVRLEGASAGLHIEAAYVLPVAATNGDLWFSYERFPPPGLRIDRLVELAGYEVAAGGAGPGDAVQVLLALSVDGTGGYGFDGLGIEYRVAGRRFRALFPFAMRVCAPAMPC